MKPVAKFDGIFDIVKVDEQKQVRNPLALAMGSRTI